ncbi:MAG: hypothetical protein U9N36_10050 [Euryarchaeota archaeon]|nr:hypothetical protein [Euryarchaeota archaeon]
MIKFKIDDVATNTGESDEYTVQVDASDPQAQVISSPTQPGGGVDAIEVVKYDQCVWLNITENGR